MARPIRETPILFGEDARRFLAAMEERRPEPPEVRARRLRNYELLKEAYERGMAEQRAVKRLMEVLIHGSKRYKPIKA